MSQTRAILPAAIVVISALRLRAGGSATPVIALVMGGTMVSVTVQGTAASYTNGSFGIVALAIAASLQVERKWVVWLSTAAMLAARLTMLPPA